MTVWLVCFCLNFEGEKMSLFVPIWHVRLYVAEPGQDGSAPPGGGLLFIWPAGLEVSCLTDGLDIEAIRSRVVEELCCIAFANVADLVEVTEDEGLRFLPTKDVDVDLRRAIAGIKVGSRGNIEIKMYDKLRALSTLLRMPGLHEQGHGVEDLGPLERMLTAGEGAERQDA